MKYLYKGQLYSIKELAEIAGCDQSTFRDRMHKGHRTVEEAVEYHKLKVKKKKRKKKRVKKLKQNIFYERELKDMPNYDEVQDNFILCLKKAMAERKVRYKDLLYILKCTQTQLSHKVNRHSGVFSAYDMLMLSEYLQFNLKKSMFGIFEDEKNEQ